MLPWIVKHRPETSEDVVGQEKAIRRLKNYISNYENEVKKAALLYGGTGTGKTSSVHAIANEMDYEIIEINASDFRNKNQIDLLIGNAINQMSLFSKSKIILIDEIDGLSGSKDRGGIQEITKLISKSRFPIVMTANEIADQKFSKLRTKSELIEFEQLSYKDVFSVLEKICKKEGIEYDEAKLKTFSRRVGTDIRAAINDLQTLTGNKRLDGRSIDEITERNKVESIIGALTKIFKTTDGEIARNALNNVDENLDKIMLWIDENLPKEYTKSEDLIRAYEKISKADIFNSRIRRRQYWRFLVYVNALLSAGIATAKDEKYKKNIEYVQTKRLLKIWQANMKYQKRKSIAQKIANETHTSVKYAITDSIPFISILIAKDKNSKMISENLDLDEAEIEWMKKTANT